MIDRTERDGIAELTLHHGRVNALDTEFLLRLGSALEEEEARESRAVVLTGAGSCLSAGVDLPRLVQGGADYVADFMPALCSFFERLASFAKPLVVAANGHAIAGGCVILCAGDWRVVGGQTSRIGLTELPVGVPFPGIAFEIIQTVVPKHRLRHVVLRGQTFCGAEAVELGLCDEVVEPTALMDRARAVAAELAAIPAATFRVAKQQVTSGLLKRANAHPDVTELWRSPATQASIQRFIEKTLTNC